MSLDIDDDCPLCGPNARTECSDCGNQNPEEGDHGMRIAYDIEFIDSGTTNACSRFCPSAAERSLGGMP